MEQMKIYPYIIDEKRMSGYYEILLDNKFKLAEYNKKKNSEIYEYFLPETRNYVLWTFNLGENECTTSTEFNKMTNDLKACTCGNYYCNIFEKGNSIVICFETGICFAISDDEKEIKKIKKYEQTIDLEKINLRKEKYYAIPEEINKEGINVNNPRLISYVIQLYKQVYLNKIQKEMQSEENFERSRSSFVKFTEKIFNLDETDKEEEKNLIENWKKELKLEETYIKVDNQFDLLYKNNKLNYNNDLVKFSIALFIVAIILGIINLWSML